MSDNRITKDDFFADLEKLAKEFEEENEKQNKSITNNKGFNERI